MLQAPIRSDRHSTDAGSARPRTTCGAAPQWAGAFHRKRFRRESGARAADPPLGTRGPARLMHEHLLMTSKTAGNLYSIVVGIDFSTACDQAVRDALTIAAGHHPSEVHAVHLLDPKHGSPIKSVRIRDQEVELAALPDRLWSYVAEHAAEVARADDTRLGVHVRVGEPVSGLLQMAVDVKADLIVVGTHGRNGLSRLALGSVAEKLARVARCPVLVSRPVDYSGLAESESIAPPCPECVQIRARTGGEQWWCDLHARPHFEPHTYSGMRPARLGLASTVK